MTYARLSIHKDTRKVLATADYYSTHEGTDLLVDVSEGVLENDKQQTGVDVPGSSAGHVPEEAPTNSTNKLLGDVDGPRLDRRAEGEAGKTDSGMEAVGVVNRSSN